MITYKTGNVLDASERVIVHGCNALGVMGAGVALQIRNKWPNVFEVYSLRHKVFGLALGEVIPVATIDGKIIVNAITQLDVARSNNPLAVNVDYNAVHRCYEIINKKVLDWEVTSVAMPMVGAGLAGGDWNIIENIINDTATNYTPVVYKYVPPTIRRMSRN